MSHWGLTYKTFEVVWPEEWNTLIDALDELWNMFSSGMYAFIPICKSGLTFNYNEYKSLLPFSGEVDAGYGYALPFPAVTKSLVAHVRENTLDGKTYVVVRKNGSETDLRVEIDAEKVGIVYLDDVEVSFDRFQEIDVAIDTTNSTNGLITFGSISILLRVLVSR